MAAMGETNSQDIFNNEHWRRFKELCSRLIENAPHDSIMIRYTHANIPGASVTTIAERSQWQELRKDTTTTPSDKLLHSMESAETPTVPATSEISGLPSEHQQTEKYSLPAAAQWGFGGNPWNAMVDQYIPVKLVAQLDNYSPDRHPLEASNFAYRSKSDKLLNNMASGETSESSQTTGSRENGPTILATTAICDILSEPQRMGRYSLPEAVLQGFRGDTWTGKAGQYVPNEPANQLQSHAPYSHPPETSSYLNRHPQLPNHFGGVRATGSSGLPLCWLSCTKAKLQDPQVSTRSYPFLQTKPWG